MDIDKQLAYWLKDADEDWSAGKDLLRTGRIRHGLFFVHLALEKVLKAHYCSNKRDIPPRSHNLARLAEIGGVNANEERMNTIADMNAYNL